MKILGKVLFGLVVMFFGLSLFQCTQQSTFTEAISYEADQAIKEKDYTFFKSIFPQHANSDLLKEEVSSELISFNLHLFLVGSENNSSIIFIVDSYSNKPSSKTLKLNVKTNNKEEVSYDLVSLGKENWYLQWLHLDRLYDGQLFVEDILDFQIKDEETLLYDFDESSGALIVSNDSNIQSYIKHQNVAISHPRTFINKADATLNEAVSEKGSSKTYSQTFNVTLGDDTEKEVYVIGNFNNYNLEDKTYKLTKGNGSDYTATFDITTDDKVLYYYIIVGDEVASDGSEALQYQRIYVDKETNLTEVNLNTVTPIKLNRYQYKIWLTMVVYLIIAGLSMWAIFFRKKKTRAEYVPTKQAPKQSPKQTPSQENLNLKAITDVQERDEDLQVHEKETVIDIDGEDKEIE